MVAVFSQILNMSMTGSIVILLVMLARILLKRSPKIFSYALWSVVLFRLLCPVSFSAPVSILSGLQPEATAVSDAVSVVSYLPDTVDLSADFVDGNSANLMIWNVTAAGLTAPRIAPIDVDATLAE